MSFHIVCDSCTDLTEEDLKKGCYTLVPLTLLVDGEEIIDDETFDQADFLARGCEVSMPCTRELYGSIFQGR